MPVTVRPDDVGRLRRCAKAEAADFSQQFGWTYVLLGPNSLFNNGE
jgi:hypothetical protein